MSQVHINTQNATSFLNNDLAEKYGAQIKEIISSMEQKSNDPGEFLG